MKIDVTILMPCLNEASTLPHCIRSAQSALTELLRHGLSGEILISDNGSTDESRKIAAEMKCRVTNCAAKGYGNALIRGVQASEGRYIVMGDADASYDFIEAVPMVLKLAEGYDICMGSRFKGRIMDGAMPWKNRYVGNPVLTGLLNLLFRSGFTDAHCGLRAFTREAFDKMRLTSPGMEFASEMVVRATLLKLKRTELPITLYPDKRSRSPHLRPWRDGKRHVKFLFAYAPLKIFFIPSILMMMFGSMVFVGLLFTPPYQTFRFGQLRLGDHWMILAGGIFSIGFQIAILGAIALFYRVKEGLASSSSVKLLSKYFTLQNAFFLGTAFIFFALCIISYVVWEWGRTGFGALYRIREMIIATTFLTMGLQAYFGILLTAIVGRKSGRPAG